MKKTILLNLVVLLVVSGFAPAATRLVPDEYATIQDAIDVAVDGDVVIVAPDTYTGDGNRDIDFGGKAITIRSENGPETCIIDCNGIEGDPHRGFNFRNGEDAKSVLSGFTITNGYSYYGGGIHCEYSSPTINNCIFHRNRTQNYEYAGPPALFEDSSQIPDNDNAVSILCVPGPPPSNGGGICCVGSNATLISCTFTLNLAISGGGMSNKYNSSPTLTECTFSGNIAKYGGGGMRNSSSNPALTNCTFIDNSAGWSGGLGNYYSSPTLTNCTFSGNSAETDGGAMNNYESNPVLTNCIFTGNSASRGGGIFNEEDSDLELTNCNFSGNIAVEHGGGMYNDESRPALTNCIFVGNSAQYGGGFSNLQSYPTVSNCTFTGNLAHVQGGGINISCGYPTLINCILWGNTAPMGPQISGYGTVLYSDVEGGWKGEGNINTNPRFVKLGYWQPSPPPPPLPPIPPPPLPPPPPPQLPTSLGASYAEDTQHYNWFDGNYHLQPHSPCIDAGEPGYVPGFNETDFDGRPRIIGSRIDMGAYEFIPPIPVEARITPHTINPASKAKWLTCYMWLGEGYDVTDIDCDSMLLEYEIGPEQFWVDEEKQVVMARFSHEEVQDILMAGELELTITIRLTNGTIFEGRDIITVVQKGGGKLARYGKASNPNPPDGATNVSIYTAYLSWTAGSGATSHDVYFGTSSPLPFVSNQATATFEPGMMDYDTTYYWRIDEVHKRGKTTGQLWSFTTFIPPPPSPPPPPPVKPPGMPGCFPAETPVWVDGAQVQISKVATGQKVGRLDATDAASCLQKPACLKEIESIHVYQGTYDYYDIVLENGNRINVVNTHYFLIASERWVLVQNLKVGSKLQSLKGPISIKTISKREEPFTDKLYNLEIKGGDRYFVGKDGVAVRAATGITSAAAAAATTTSVGRKAQN